MNPIRFLLLVSLGWASCGAQAAPPQPASAPVWQQSQNTDAVRAMTYERYTLVGHFLKSPQNVVPNRPALVVDCIPAEESHASKGRYLTGSLLIGIPLKIIYVEPEEIHGTSYYPKIAVGYRTDDAKEEQEKWSPLTEKEKTAASIPKDSLKKILRAHSLTITAQDERGLPVAMSFAMPDPKGVEAGCNVD
jgi:hypothetical protein